MFCSFLFKNLFECSMSKDSAIWLVEGSQGHSDLMGSVG